MILRERLARALAAGAGRDAPLVAEDMIAAVAPVVPAAVLIAVTDRPVPGVLLTQRTPHLRQHAGQVAFPGGRIDPEDDGAVAAALREAEEEIGLPRGVPEIVGTLEVFATRTGYAITPVVAVVPPDLPLLPHEHEVASIFEVPLAFLLDEANHHEQRAMWEGAERVFYEIPHAGPTIWGVSAAIVINLGRRLDRAMLGPIG